MEQYNITGMSCAACSARVEKAVSKVPGVESCSVSLLTNILGVDGDANPRSIVEAVEKAGYGASKRPSRHNSNQKEALVETQSSSNVYKTDTPIDVVTPNEEMLRDKESPHIAKRLIASLILLLPLMYVSMGHMMWGWPIPSAVEGNYIAIGLYELILSAAVMIVNKKFFINGFKSTIHFAPNMDALVALGSGASFVYSTCMLFAMTFELGNSEKMMHYAHEFYFESAAMILTLITVGKLLESLSKGKTTNALKELMKLSPKEAVIIKDDKEVRVAIESVVIGDIFVVRPGENIPVDGVVIEGNSAVNESALTGESVPVDKEKGSTVSAATINQSGFLKCQATRVGNDTTLSQIISMVSDAAATKAPIAKVADRVSGIFVPVVIAIAVVTFIIWMAVGQNIGYSLARAISVLVISCPCALGLATPVAIMVGNGMGARHGILFKTAVSLEATGKADVVVLDKTGTLTKGEPEVTDIITAKDVSENELLQMAMTLEKKSEHPLAGAIVRFCESKNIKAGEIAEFSAVPGNGLMGRINTSQFYFAGNKDFIEKQKLDGIKIEIPAEIIKMSDVLSNSGKTPLYFARQDKFMGCIAVADVVREDSAMAVEQIRDMGIRVVMLTGDNERTAAAIGEMTGVDEVVAGVLPDGKEEAIRRLQNQGKVIMVGDGINDAPALTRADVGIAIGAGTDVAIDAADVVVMRNSILDVAAAIRLSQATLRNIHENLFWAFIYNCIGIPLAAGAYIHTFGWTLNPMFGAAAMSLSSFCVIINALRLNFTKMYKKKTTNQKDIKETNTMTKTINITGMMCGHCEASVKKGLEALQQVEMAEVSHTQGTAVVTLKEEVDNEVLTKVVEDLEYTVTSVK